MTEDLVTARAEQVMYRTKDPTMWIGKGPAPALTTMLHRVCDNDQRKFREACRLVGLFIEEALNEPA